jgi:pre-60S factor REI1
MIHDADAAFEYSEYYDYSTSYPEGAESVNADELYQPEVLKFNDDMQLVLPSGKALGHRALKVYYRQYVRPGSQLVTNRRQIRVNKILSQYKAIGYDQTTLAVAQQKYRDQKYIKMVKDKYREKVSIRGNKTLQHHFRCQVMF